MYEDFEELDLCEESRFESLPYDYFALDINEERDLWEEELDLLELRINWI